MAAARKVAPAQKATQARPMSTKELFAEGLKRVDLDVLAAATSQASASPSGELGQDPERLRHGRERLRHGRERLRQARSTCAMVGNACATGGNACAMAGKASATFRKLPPREIDP